MSAVTEVAAQAHAERVVPRAATRRRERRRRAGRIAWNVVGLAVFAIVVFPIFWMISTAFKPDDEINSFTPTWFSTGPTLDHFRDAMARPYFWETVKNSLVVVGAVVVLSMVVAFLAAPRRFAKYRFTGNKLFVVLVIGILMLLQAGLVIPLYVVLARYGLTNELMGLVLTHLVILPPFAIWTLRGFIMGIPKEPEVAMVDGSERLGAFTRSCCFVAPGPSRRPCRLHHELERVHLRERDPHRPGEPDVHRLALVLLRDEPEHGLGGPHGRVDADRDPRRDLLPHRAAEDRVRADGRRGQGMSHELERLASNCIFPVRGPVAPDWVRRRVGEGLGGVAPSTPGTSRAATSCGRSPTT